MANALPALTSSKIMKLAMLGGGVLIFASYKAYTHYRLLDIGVTAPAVVMSVDQTRGQFLSRAYGNRYYANLVYKTPDEREWRAFLGPFKSTVAAGTEVEVIYDPANPDDVEAVGSSDRLHYLWGAGCLSVLGIFVFAYRAYYRRLHRLD